MDQLLSSVDRFVNFYECNGCRCHVKVNVRQVGFILSSRT